jgi:hypothetical protein
MDMTGASPARRERQGRWTQGALEGPAHLDSGAIVELEESWWVVIDVNHLDANISVLMQWGLPAICGSESQGVAGCLLQDAQFRELATRPLMSAP